MIDELYVWVPLLSFVLLLTVVVYSIWSAFYYTHRKDQQISLLTVCRMLREDAALFLVIQLAYYCLGRLLMIRGDFIMSSSQLILSIASAMHKSAIAFTIASLLVTLFCLYSAMSLNGNMSALKQLLRTCVSIAVLFWVLCWLIL